MQTRDTVVRIEFTGASCNHVTLTNSSEQGEHSGKEDGPGAKVPGLGGMGVNTFDACNTDDKLDTITIP